MLTLTPTRTMKDLNLLTAERVYDLVAAAACDSQAAYLRCLVLPTKRYPLVTLTIFNVDGTPYAQHIFEVDYYSHLYDLCAEYDFYNRKSLAGFISKLGTFQDVPFQHKTYHIAQAA